MTIEEPTIFQAELDYDWRGTIITSLTETPVAYAYGHPGNPITQLFIPDRTKRYLMKLWKVN